MIRSMVFLPGNTPNMLLNGEILEADAVILDLEDAVSPNEKDSARILVRNFLRKMRSSLKQVIVRINSMDTEYWKKDLEVIVPLKPDAVMATKVSGPGTIAEISSYMDEIEKAHGMQENTVRLLALIETAQGIRNVYRIAAEGSRICGMLLGAEDLTADLHCRRTKEGTEIFYARNRLVCAARAAGIEAYDTPFPDVEDMEGLKKDTELAKMLGFTGKAVISPRHIECVNEAFSPSMEEIEYSRLVLETIQEAKKQGKGVVSLKGKMIDAPIVERARQVCQAAEQIYGGIS